MTPTFSVIVPTTGRPSLWRTLASVVDQLEDDDELIVVADTRDAETPGRVLETIDDFTPCPLVYLEAAQPASRFGNAQRDAGMAIASGSHLLFLDDDDIHVPGSLDIVRRELVKSEMDWNDAHVFRARWGLGHHAAGAVLWATPEVREQNVGTPMVCLPNRDYQHSWMDGNSLGTVSDFAFLASAIGECGWPPSWHADVIATVRP